MKVGILGFGKAGRAVASVLLKSKKTELQWVIHQSSAGAARSVSEFLRQPSDEPGCIYSRNEFSAAELLDRMPVDVIVDFSSPSGLDYYGDEAARRGIVIVTAVSQYDGERMDRLSELARQTPILHSPNITLGVNFLILAARVLKNIAPEADVEIVEEHFRQKNETSGTARVIADNLGLDESAIKSVRAGGIIGVHEILFGLPYQTVRLKHESIGREAFGNGILFALDNMKDKGPGLHTMGELMRPYFELQPAAQGGVQ